MVIIASKSMPSSGSTFSRASIMGPLKLLISIAKSSTCNGCPPPTVPVSSAILATLSPTISSLANRSLFSISASSLSALVCCIASSANRSVELVSIASLSMRRDSLSFSLASIWSAISKAFALIWRVGISSRLISFPFMRSSSSPSVASLPVVNSKISPRTVFASLFSLSKRAPPPVLSRAERSTPKSSAVKDAPTPPIFPVNSAMRAIASLVIAMRLVCESNRLAALSAASCLSSTVSISSLIG